MRAAGISRLAAAFGRDRFRSGPKTDLLGVGPRGSCRTVYLCLPGGAAGAVEAGGGETEDEEPDRDGGEERDFLDFAAWFSAFIPH